MPVFGKVIDKMKEIQIGIDIGSYSVKAAAILHSKKGPNLVQFSIKNVNNDIVSAITAAHSELGIAKSKVVSSVSGPSAMVRYIDMPCMTDDELQSALKFEAEKIIPYNIDEIELDAQIIEPLDGNRMRVMIAACKKDLLKKRIDMLSSAGLKPIIMDIDNFALANSFMSSDIDTESACGLINIGYSKTDVHIVKACKSYFSREIDIGLNQALKLVSDNMSISNEEALKALEDRLGGLQDGNDAVSEILLDVFSRLYDEIRLSFDFYENRYANSVFKVYISGGIAVYEPAIAMLKQISGRDVEKWSPFNKIYLPDELLSKDIHKLAPQLAISVGLALRRVE
jgi:type IV pilus assembly protein PilM